MLSEISAIISTTLIPTLELRASIPLGIGLGVPWLLVFFIAVLTNIVLGPIIFMLIGRFIHLFEQNKRFEKYYNKIIERTQRKIHKYTEKYGEWAIAAFIAIPLPGSGSYSGALAAYLIGLSFRKFVISNLIGVTIAGVLVTMISLGIYSLV
ncbi:small multi-drug export protein [archaeon]|nr:small multi-drug export protein [archaeon]